MGIDKRYLLGGDGVRSTWSRMRKANRLQGMPMHEPWINDFYAFLRYVGERPLDAKLRVKAFGIGYVPGNLQWKYADLGEYRFVDKATIAEHVTRKRRTRLMADLPAIGNVDPDTIARIESMRLSKSEMARITRPYIRRFLSLYS